MCCVSTGWGSDDLQLPKWQVARLWGEPWTGAGDGSPRLPLNQPPYTPWEQVRPILLRPEACRLSTMAPPAADTRPFDIVLLGATGFVGELNDACPQAQSSRPWLCVVQSAGAGGGGGPPPWPLPAQHVRGYMWPAPAGKLVCEEVAHNYAENVKWAIAGRDPERLDKGAPPAAAAAGLVAVPQPVGAHSHSSM